MERERDRRISCGPSVSDVRDTLRCRVLALVLGALDSDNSDGAREIDRTDADDARDTSSRDGMDGRVGRAGGGRYEDGMGWANIFWWNVAHKSGCDGR